MTFVSRNALCPCGSGRKYKRCHGAPAAAASADPLVTRAERVKALDRDLAQRILRFGRARFGDNWLDDIIDEYDDGSDAGFDDAETQIAIPWGMYDRLIPGTGLSVARAFRDDQGPRLPADMLRLLDANLESWLSVWEIRRVDPGVGLHLADLFTGEERFIHEVSGSRTAEVRSALLAKVVDFEGVSFGAATHPHPLPPRDANAVMKEFRDLARVARRRVTRKLLRNPDNQLDLIDFWRDQVQRNRERPMPSLTNTDGDPFLLTTDHFDVAAGAVGVAAVIERLGTFPGAAEPEEGTRGETVFTITKPGNRTHKDWDNTVIGTIGVTAARLRLESNSTRRANQLRAGIEKHLGDLVSHRLREEMGQEAMLREARGRGSRARASHDEQPPELAALAVEIRKRHMAAWLDDPVPALDGFTPRQAAAKPKMRAKLDLLLRDFEHMEARVPEAERVDIAGLRAELGFLE